MRPETAADAFLARLAARNNYIHWAQEPFDQGAMLREELERAL